MFALRKDRPQNQQLAPAPRTPGEGAGQRQQRGEGVRGSRSEVDQVAHFGLDLDLAGIGGTEDIVVDDNDLDDPELLAQLQELARPSPSHALPKARREPPPQRSDAKHTPKPEVATELDLDEFRQLGTEHADHLDVELTEADMNDPVLLGELKAMGYVSEEEEEVDEGKRCTRSLLTTGQVAVAAMSPAANQVPVPAPARQQAALAEPALPRLPEPPADSAGVLASGKDLRESAPEPDVGKGAPLSLPTATPTQEAASDGTQDTRSVPLEDLTMSSDTDEIRRRIAEEKKTAIARNRAGDKAGAAKALRAYKALEARLTEPAKPAGCELKSAVADLLATTVVATVPPAPAAVATPAITVEAVAENDTNHIPRTPSTASLSSKQATPAKQISAAGSRVNSAGNLPTLVLPGPSDEGVTMPRLSALLVFYSSLPLSSYPSPTPQNVSQAYAKLEQQLESQAALCSSIAAHFLKSGDKANALAFHKHRKSFLADLESVRSYASSGQPVPRFRYVSVSHTVAAANFDVSPGEMELAIDRAFGLGNKEVLGQDVEAYVSWDAGWPTDAGGATAAAGKGDTLVAKRGMDPGAESFPNGVYFKQHITSDYALCCYLFPSCPEFRFAKRIPIERTKAFQRYVERKKVQFEVMHYRGFFRSKIHLGKCQLKIDSLLSKCEVHEILQLTDANRRPTGGKLEVRLRLRTPLLKSEVDTRTDQWVVMDDFSSGASTLAAGSPMASPATPSLPTPSQRSGTTSPVAPRLPVPVAAVPVSPAKYPTAAAKKATTGAKGPVEAPKVASPSVNLVAPPAVGASAVRPVENNEELETTIEWFESVDNIASSALLEHDLSLISSGRSGLPPTEAEDRRQQLELKMNLLATYVQAGILTLPKYLQGVEACLAQSKKAALLFKRAGRMDLAVRAM
ncbi:MAG: hypothetical protein BJ554DRAFT_5996, partial [Olpidium bornovanus]